MNYRFPSLDGLRAISILAVLHSHVSISTGYPIPSNKFTTAVFAFFSGDLGVNIFFVISGFLITSLLLEEESQNGNISLKSFYLRRAFRILPVYSLYIAFVFVCKEWRVVNDIEAFSFIPPLTFTTGTLPIDTGWSLAHTWSLSIEEQFYLLWPIAFTFILNRKSRTYLLIGVALIAPVSRSVYYYFSHQSQFYAFILRGDCISMGCLLALNQEWFSRFISNRNSFRWYLAITCMISITLTILAENRQLGILTVPFVIFSQGVLAVLLIFGYCLKPRIMSFVYKTLNLPILIQIGILSYSLYIWQQFFLQSRTHIIYFWKEFPFNLSLTIVTAFASYYFLEKPFINIRKTLFSQKK